MRSLVRPVVVVCVSFVLALSLMALFASRWNARVRASRVSLAEIAARYPVGSPAHAMAVRREMMRRRHPHWTDLSVSEIAARLETLVRRALVRPHDSGSAGAPPVAPFLGDYTAVSGPTGETFMLVRQSDCSLTEFAASYSVVPPSYTISSTVPHFERTLHQLAGMTTTADAFPSGCAPSNGSQADSVYVGETLQSLYAFATEGYDRTSGNNTLYYATIDSSYNFHAIGSDGTNVNISGVVAGDLNKDGNGDVIELSYGECTLSVLLGNSDGTFGSLTPYSCSGYGTEGAVVADLNGDGNPDVAVVSQDGHVTIMLGAGDGTLRQGQTLSLSTSNTSNGANLIVADTRGIGRKDIIASTGDLLLSNGDGTFTLGTRIAFPSDGATSDFGPNMASADLNKDGKVDVVYDDGDSIDIYLGNGDGTFTAGMRYATIDNVGHVTIADLDGDGNLDIYTGLAGGPFFLGDRFEINEGYVLLGNGDGTFQGAPVAPVSYSGTNLADVNGDGQMDLIGGSVSSTDQSLSFTTYLGQKDGSFAASGPVLNVSTITASNVTQGATTYSGLGLNAYAVADVNGDGRADLLFIPAVQTSYYQRDILCVAFGQSDGSFAQPSCVEMSSLLSNPGTLPTGGPDFDSGLVANGLQVLDLNGDGKPDIFYSYVDNDYGAGTTMQGFVMQPGNGDGTFGTPKVLQLFSGVGVTTGQLPQFSLFADVNGDGRPDLITTTITGQLPSNTMSVSLNLNNGDGSFGSASTLQLGLTNVETSILAADMNGDGKIDLITDGDDNSGNSNISITLGNGDGTFAAPKLLAISDADGDTNGLAVGDFNGDGKVDLAVLSYSNYFSGIYLGNGDGTLQTATDAYGDVLPAETIPLNVGGPAIAHDFNGDGKLDLLAANTLLRSVAVPSISTTGTTTSTTSLSASPTSAIAGQSVTLTATVTGPSGNTTVPTGTVTFLDGATTLGAGTLSSTGVATFSTTSLSDGAHSITASYAGDTNFAASTSSAVTVTVSAPTPSFTLSLSPSSGTVSGAGGTVTATVSVSPSNGFNSATALSCSGLPVNAACSFSPGTVSPGTSAVTSTLTITTAVASAHFEPLRLPSGSTSGRPESAPFWPSGVALASGSFCAAILVFKRRDRRSFYRILSISLFVVCALLLAACNGSKASTHTPPGTSSVQIIGTAGALSHSAVFTLTVQ